MTSIYHKQIDEDRIAFLVNKKIDPDIASINLEMVKMKLAEPEEGKGWTEEQGNVAEIEYKRYLTLCRKYPAPAYSIVPNNVIDEMWHYHILDTRAYVKDSDSIFGGYFHHFPYFGMRGEEDEKNLKSAFEKTKNLYEKEFGESMVRSEHQKCWHDCENRCHNACSSIEVVLKEK